MCDIVSNKIEFWSKNCQTYASNFSYILNVIFFKNKFLLAWQPNGNRYASTNVFISVTKIYSTIMLIYINYCDRNFTIFIYPKLFVFVLVFLYYSLFSCVKINYFHCRELMVNT